MKIRGVLAGEKLGCWNATLPAANWSPIKIGGLHCLDMAPNLMATLSAGVLAGYLAAARVPLSRATRSSSVVCVITCMCRCFLLFSRLSDPYLAVIALFLAGLANGYWSIFFETAVQRVIPWESLGRVYACCGLLSGGLIPAASLAGGVVLDVLNQDTRTFFSVCAVIMTAYPLVLLSSGRFVSFFDYLKRVSREA